VETGKSSPAPIRGEHALRSVVVMNTLDNVLLAVAVRGLGLLIVGRRARQMTGAAPVGVVS